MKYVSRNDRFKAFRKEDLAVGLDLAVTALIIFITHSAEIARRAFASGGSATAFDDRLIVVPWLIAAFVIGIWGLSTTVRKLGWRDEDNLNLFWGIALPDIFGLFSLIFVVNWIS